jgi:hypothetical protein
VVSPWSLDALVQRSVDWYKGALGGQDAWKLTMNQIEDYQADCSRAAASTRG